MQEKQEIKEEEEEEFENILSGLERANIRLYQFSLLVLYPTGFWKHYTLFAFILFEIIGVYFLITVAVALYQQLDEIFILFETAHAYLLLFGIMVNLNDFHVRKVRNFWYRLLVLCKEDFYEYECESVRKESVRLRSLSELNMKWFFNIAIPGILVNLIMVMVVIPLVRLYFNEEQKTSDTSFNVYFPLSVWSPFNSRTVAGFMFTYLLLFIFTSKLLIIIMVYISTIFYFYMELIIQLRILCYALQKHDERLKALQEKVSKIKKFDSTTSTTTYYSKQAENDYCITEILKEPIVHYLKIRDYVIVLVNAIRTAEKRSISGVIRGKLQGLSIVINYTSWTCVRFFNTFQDFSSFVFGLMLTINMLAIVAMSLLLTRIDSLLTVDGFKFCLILSFEVLNLFMYTYCGSMLIEENQSASRFLLMAAGIYAINLNTFIQVIQTAYSVFNVFNRIKT